MANITQESQMRTISVDLKWIDGKPLQPTDTETKNAAKSFASVSLCRRQLRWPATAIFLSSRQTASVSKLGIASTGSWIFEGAAQEIKKGIRDITRIIYDLLQPNSRKGQYIQGGCLLGCGLILHGHYFGFYFIYKFFGTFSRFE